LTNPKVIEEIEAARAKLIEKIEVTSERILSDCRAREAGQSSWIIGLFTKRVEMTGESGGPVEIAPTDPEACR
jgi:hypothetical protein